MEFRDLKTQYQQLKPNIDQAVLDVMQSAHFIGGSQVKELEKELAEFVGVKHCITCANGTEALSLILMAWNIKEGDAVFVPDFTFFASGEVVSFNGATPVFVDVEEDTFNINVQKLEEAIIKIKAEGTLTPKVVIPVDLFGLPANYPAIQQVAEKYNLLILEDSAQGFGGAINGQRAGSFGHAATTSFFPAKPLGCYGDGGAIFTNDDELALLIESLKVHGKGDDKYDNVRIGVNSRLDTIQAAILQVKLKAFADYELDAVNHVYKEYTTLLTEVVPTPVIPEGYYSSFAQYTIKLESKEQRDALQLYLKEKGIPTMIYYIKPMHKQGAFSDLSFNEEDFEVTNKLSDTVLSLPMHPYLKKEEIAEVSTAIKEFMKKEVTV
jgi:UDP-2-acetamido-2-deoxy-ribo-hexuluronate aminotransferase